MSATSYLLPYILSKTGVNDPETKTIDPLAESLRPLRDRLAQMGMAMSTQQQPSTPAFANVPSPYAQLYSGPQAQSYLGAAQNPDTLFKQAALGLMGLRMFGIDPGAIFNGGGGLPSPTTPPSIPPGGYVPPPAPPLNEGQAQVPGVGYNTPQGYWPGDVTVPGIPPFAPGEPGTGGGTGSSGIPVPPPRPQLPPGDTGLGKPTPDYTMFQQALDILHSKPVGSEEWFNTLAEIDKIYAPFGYTQALEIDAAYQIFPKMGPVTPEQLAADRRLREMLHPVSGMGGGGTPQILTSTGFQPITGPLPQSVLTGGMTPEQGLAASMLPNPTPVPTAPTSAVQPFTMPSPVIQPIEPLYSGSRLMGSLNSEINPPGVTRLPWELI